MTDFDVNSVPQNEGDVDSLLASIEAPSARVEESTPEVAPEPQVETPAPQPQSDEYVINWRGQERKLTRDQVINYAQQAYDYNEKNRQFNVERQLFDQKQKAEAQRIADLETRTNRYREVEDYIKRDPQWWEHVNQSWQNRSQDPARANPYEPVINELTQKVESLSGYISQQQEREKLTAQANQDAELDGAVTEYRTLYPDLDWKTADQNGQDLERRILDHAVKNNIGSFKAAANDFLFDELLNREKLKALEEKGKEIKKVTKLGLGPVTDKPPAKIQGVKNLRAKTWNDPEFDADEILRELGA